MTINLINSTIYGAKESVKAFCFASIVTPLVPIWSDKMVVDATGTAKNSLASIGFNAESVCAQLEASLQNIQEYSTWAFEGISSGCTKAYEALSSVGISFPIWETSILETTQTYVNGFFNTDGAAEACSKTMEEGTFLQGLGNRLINYSSNVLTSASNIAKHECFPFVFGGIALTYAVIRLVGHDRRETELNRIKKILGY